ncbi:MAG: lipid biosynthesis acyltransferase [Variovorax sp.]|nr:lipid biosynthesis acyltransferase [Variovorax sp.]
MRLLSHWPLAWIRALGAVMGAVLYVLVVPRRRVVATNLRLCFPEASPAQRRRWALRTFIYFSQAWLDRSWLWHAPLDVLHRRLHLVGDVDALRGSIPTIVFAPHFYGLDAAASAIAINVERTFTTIYTRQRDPRVDAWIREGRTRFGDVKLFNRLDGIKTNLADLRAGGVLYLLPDMNFGPQESIFVPFYGVPAATVPSLSRFARLGRAQVVPVIPRMTRAGYEVTVHPAWHDFPTQDAEADTARMNRELEGFIDTMPAQYYWVHKRFKTRPPGEAPVY